MNCPDCGAQNRSIARFCGSCSVPLGDIRLAVEPDAPTVHLRRRTRRAATPLALKLDEAAPAKSDAVPSASPVEADVLVPVAEVEESGTSAGTVLEAGHASISGRVHEIDEDSLCVLTLSMVHHEVAGPTMGLFIVADGVGGAQAGDVASQLAVQTIADRITREVLLPRICGENRLLNEAVCARLVDATCDANRKLHDYAQRRAGEMACTMVVALVMDGHTTVAHVGDCRAYVYSGTQLRRITEDHSVVAGLVAAGEVEPDDLYSHPERHLVYRSLGGKPEVEVDSQQIGLTPGDLLLLCSDGLWASIREEGIEKVMRSCHDPQSACIELVRQANDISGEDNISAILVRFAANPVPFPTETSGSTRTGAVDVESTTS